MLQIFASEVRQFNSSPSITLDLLFALNLGHPHNLISLKNVLLDPTFPNGRSYRLSNRHILFLSKVLLFNKRQTIVIRVIIYISCKIKLFLFRKVSGDSKVLSRSLTVSV